MLKFPQLVSFDEYIQVMSDFINLDTKEKLKLPFRIHDFDEDNKIDYNDAYDLLYSEKEVKT